MPDLQRAALMAELREALYSPTPIFSYDRAAYALMVRCLAALTADDATREERERALFRALGPKCVTPERAVELWPRSVVLRLEDAISGAAALLRGET